MIYHCCDRLRRRRVIEETTLNGIDYLEVLDHDAPPGPSGQPLRQQTLLVRLLRPVPADFKAQQVCIEGGERVREVRVQWVAPASAPPPAASLAEQDYLKSLTEADHMLVVRTDRYGDFSPYRLRVLREGPEQGPPEGFDPRMSEIGFSFKVACPSEFDCAPRNVCPEEPAKAPVIDYLAKDYPSFRRLILDRITQRVPGWRERSAADLGVTLAEWLAYVCDQLSYQQDAVGTEAYLETARLRTSLRRLALLVDYPIHDGCNARVWLQVLSSADAVALPRSETRFHTKVAGLPPRITPDSREDEKARKAAPTIFEPLHDAVLYAAHNEIEFYTWGEERCCLPKGATRATLSDDLRSRLLLRRGDVLIFEERVGPHTGRPEDANPTRRHVVRLTAVSPEAQQVLSNGREVGREAGALLKDPLPDPGGAVRHIVEVAWAIEDKLPFPLCISSVSDEEHGERFISNVSVARGNVVLADHGWTLPAMESLGTVPRARLAYPPDRDRNRCADAEPTEIPPRFAPRLANGPLTLAGTVLKTRDTNGKRIKERLPFDADLPAASAMQWRREDILPAIQVSTVAQGNPGQFESWEARRDLLNSEADDRHFVVEVEHDGSARLRFGDDVHGRRAKAGMAFGAHYRVGNGRVGNVGAGAIAHVVSSDSAVLGVRNPLPASGGEDMEDAASVRRAAPQAFRRQERAVTPEDYAEVTERHVGVQRAAATLRWTGSWHTVFVTVDRLGGLPMTPAFENELTRHVDHYRMAGHDTEFNDPVFVSLEIDLLVCVQASHFRADVRAGLLEVLGNRLLPDGRRGLFHPDNLSFGQTVFLSPLYAAARQVAGVASVEVTRFHRQGMEDPRYLVDGFMRLSRLEIPRLDNDPNFPEHGVLRLNLFGGK